MKKTDTYVIPSYIYVMWATLVVAIVFGIYSTNWSTVFISLIAFGLSAYATQLKNQFDFKIPSSLLTAAIIFIYATLFLGEVGDFYNRFWWWDVILHTGSAVGFGLIGAIILILLFHGGKVKASPWLVSIFVFAFAMAIGATWEIFEFSMDQIFGLNMQKSGLVDTMADLIVDGIGALLAAITSFIYLTKGKTSVLTGVLSEAVENN